LEVSISESQADANFISRLFHGQFQSTLTCPSCGKESVKIESFLTLSLHIPDIQRIPVYVTVVPSSQPDSDLVKVAVVAKECDTVRNLRESLAELRKIEFDQVKRPIISMHKIFS
jgi:ubiquitin C-terminal hydrolase